MSDAQGDTPLRYERLVEDVRTILKRGKFDVDMAPIIDALEEVTFGGIRTDLIAERFEAEQKKRYFVQCKATGLAGAYEAKRIIDRWGRFDRPEKLQVDQFWLICGWGVSKRFRDVFRREGNPRYRMFTLDEFEEVTKHPYDYGAQATPGRVKQAPKRAKGAQPSARTKIGKTTLINRVQIILSSAALLALIDEKIELLEGARPNSDEAQKERDRALEQYTALRLELKQLSEDVKAFTKGETKEAAVVKSSKSFADGVRSWWNKGHEKICDKAFDMGMFFSAVGICHLSGATGNVGVVVSAALVGGRPVADVLKAAGKKLFG